MPREEGDAAQENDAGVIPAPNEGSLPLKEEDFTNYADGLNGADPGPRDSHILEEWRRIINQERVRACHQEHRREQDQVIRIGQELLHRRDIGPAWDQSNRLASGSRWGVGEPE